MMDLFVFWGMILLIMGCGILYGFFLGKRYAEYNETPVQTCSEEATK